MAILITRLVAALFLALAPLTAHAAGGDDISEGFFGLIVRFAPLWISAAVLVLVIAGFTLMVSQDEGRLDKAKKTIAAVMIGGIIIVIILSGPRNFVSIMYNGIPGLLLINTGGYTIGYEAAGIANWLTAMAAMFGILMIIITVIRAVASFGDESSYQNTRMSMLHVLFGLIVIGAAYLFEVVFFADRTPNALIALIASKILVVLLVITTIAVFILIYVGIRMIASFGQEDQYTAAKSLAIRVLLGLLVILVSYTLVVVVALIFA